jgi:hypothetical protein
VPIEVAEKRGTRVVDNDEHPRPGTTAEALAKLRAAFRQGRRDDDDRQRLGRQRRGGGDRRAGSEGCRGRRDLRQPRPAEGPGRPAGRAVLRGGRARGERIGRCASRPPRRGQPRRRPPPSRRAPWRAERPVPGRPPSRDRSGDPRGAREQVAAREESFACPAQSPADDGEASGNRAPPAEQPDGSREPVQRWRRSQRHRPIPFSVGRRFPARSVRGRSGTAQRFTHGTELRAQLGDLAPEPPALRSPRRHPPRAAGTCLPRRLPRRAAGCARATMRPAGGTAPRGRGRRKVRVRPTGKNSKACTAGAELSHREGGCSFETFLRRY